VSGHEIRTATFTVNNNSGSATATCTAGKKVVGGGVTHGNVDTYVQESGPNAAGTGWFVRAEKFNNGNTTVTVHAICVTAP
jgi:hypothetical protein